MEKNYSPVIGIPAVPVDDMEKLSVTALYDDYRKMLMDKKCIPFMLPPYKDINYFHTELDKIESLTEEEMEIYKRMVDMCDGIIIPGGYRMYNFQEFIINYAIEKDIPVLGTCLGMQILANIDNKAYSLKEDETGKHRQRDVDYVHNVSIVPNTHLSEILNEKEIPVNSVHKYYVEKTNNLIVSAYSDDGIIEAIEMPNKRFVLGVQWHPEKMFRYDLNANKLIDSFVSECKKSKILNNDNDVKLMI